MDFWKLLDPFLGFTVKTVPGIHDPRISWLPFETKNYEMWEPPVVWKRRRDNEYLWHVFTKLVA